MFDKHDPLRRQALESASELFHEASKLRESDTTLGRAVWSVNTSPTIRRIISRPALSLRGYPSIPLPIEQNLPMQGLTESLSSRRSTRAFSGEPLTLPEMSALLYYGGAVTGTNVDTDGISWGLRCAPSGGALFPIELYCAVQRVTSLDDGLYAYVPMPHSLHLVSAGPVTAAMERATFLEETVRAAAVTIVMVANFPRTKFKYGERGYRFALLEAGHIAQNILLVAASLKVGSLVLGGFVDDQMNAFVGADGCDRAAVYAVIAGRIALPAARV
jgi:SagB-type dehydrogenase family enzyme